MYQQAAIIPPYRWPKKACGEGDFMFPLPPQFLRCVAFLCEAELGANGAVENIPTGTAFFVRWPDEINPSQKWSYIVTARHCIEEPASQDLFLRVNTHASDAATGLGYKDIATKKLDWHTHDSADVAAMLFADEDENVDFAMFPSELFINKDYAFVPNVEIHGQAFTDFFMGKWGHIPMQLGMDLSFGGLFIQSVGDRRNLPIVRFGSISRLPTDELIYLDTPSRGAIGIRAYLAECRSWGGHSGSPVLWHFVFNMNVIEDDGRLLALAPLHATALLGLVSAHFDIDIEAKHSPEAVVIPINSGMAIVTPAENIRELLAREDLVEERNRRRQPVRRKLATADSAKRTNRDIDIPPIARDDFFDALKKATRKRKPSS